ncbi:MAG: GNAT family N-acetyltransferase [Chloroflexota bacterium]|nr:GNAT family N-acetyltransferase [Chloroflexota bacterium]
MIQISPASTSWSTFVKEHSAGEFYYTPEWFALIEKLYGYTIVPLTTTNADGEITGFLPLCLVNSRITGKHVVGLPFSDQCPLLATDETSAQQLIDKAIAFAQQEKAHYLELRTGNNDVLAARTDLVAGNLYTRWQLPLPASADTIWSGLRKPIQRQIKKAQNQGVQVRIAQDRKDIMQYYRLHLMTRSKHGMPAQSQRFFLKLWDAFAAQGKVQVLLAEYEGKVIAGMVLLLSDTTVRYAYGASDESYLHLGPNNLLMWTAIQMGCEQGYQTLDMGRTSSDNEGLMEFKRRWGAIKEELPYYYYPQMAGLASTSETSLKFRLLTACWKKLPLTVAGLLGALIYKHLG